MINVAKSDRLIRGIHRWLREPRPAWGTIDLAEKGVVIGTEIGLVRKENQDRAIYASYKFCDSRREDFELAIVCDGIGGTAHGGGAATLAVSEVVAHLAFAPAETSFALRLANAIREANQSVYERFGGRGGTTIAALIVSKRMIVASTVGDSRVYELHDHRINQLSLDDTLADEVKRVSGEKAAQSLPESLSRSLAQYVGMGEGIEPRLHLIPLASKSRIMLSSDGAHRWPNNVLGLFHSAAPGLHIFVNRILALSKWTGGVDNATVLVVEPQKFFARDIDTDDFPVLVIWDSFGRAEYIDPFTQPVTHDLRQAADVPIRKPADKSRKKTKPIREAVKPNNLSDAKKAEPEQRVLTIEISGSGADDSALPEPAPGVGTGSAPSEGR